MIDIFDEAKPVVIVTRRALWAVATHHLMFPIVYLLCSLSCLVAVYLIVRRASSVVCATSSVSVPVPIIHAYIIPRMRVSMVSVDDSSVTIDLTSPSGLRSSDDDPCRALFNDVVTAKVNMIVVCGDIWFVTKHPSIGSALILTSQANVAYPIGARKLAVGASEWTTQWDTNGLGALVIAFKDINIMAYT